MRLERHMDHKNPNHYSVGDVVIFYYDSHKIHGRLINKIDSQLEKGFIFESFDPVSTLHDCAGRTSPRHGWFMYDYYFTRGHCEKIQDPTIELPTNPEYAKLFI